MELPERNRRNSFYEVNGFVKWTGWRRGDAGPGIIRGVWGFSHARFGGLGEKAPIVGNPGCALVARKPLLLNPDRCILGDSQGNTSVFWLIATQPPNRFPAW